MTLFMKNRLATFLGLSLGLASGGLNIVAQNISNGVGGYLNGGNVIQAAADPVAVSLQTPQMLQTLHNGYLIAGAVLGQSLFSSQQQSPILDIPNPTKLLGSTQTYAFQSQDAELMSRGASLSSAAQLAWVNNPAHSDAPWNVVLDASNEGDAVLLDATYNQIGRMNAVAGLD